MFAGYAEDDGKFDETITNKNEALEVKYDEESLLEEEGVDLLQQKEFIDEILFGVKQSDEVDIDQKSNDNSIVGPQEGKPMNLFNGINERCLQYDDVENRSTQEDCQEKNKAENGNCDELMETFYKEIEFLEKLLKEPKGETKLTEPHGGKGVEDRINKYDAEIREIEQHNESDDQLQSKVWDTGWTAEETHDQEVMETFNFGSLMQEHSGLVSNVIVWSHVVTSKGLKENNLIKLFV